MLAAVLGEVLPRRAAHGGEGRLVDQGLGEELPGPVVAAVAVVEADADVVGAAGLQPRPVVGPEVEVAVLAREPEEAGVRVDHVDQVGVLGAQVGDVLEREAGQGGVQGCDPRQLEVQVLGGDAGQLAAQGVRHDPEGVLAQARLDHTRDGARHGVAHLEEVEEGLEVGARRVVVPVDEDEVVVAALKEGVGHQAHAGALVGLRVAVHV